MYNEPEQNGLHSPAIPLSSPQPSAPAPNSHTIMNGTWSRDPTVVASGSEMELVQVEDTNHQAWRHKGYRAFSTWTASSADAFAIRRFGVLHARTILWLQHRISKLESDMEKNDKFCRIQLLPPAQQHLANSGSFVHDEMYRPERVRILEELLPLLEQYDRLLWYHSNLKARPSAPKHVIQNIRNWFEDNKHAIKDEEQQFIERDQDLMAVVSRERTPLRKILEKIPLFKGWRCFHSRKDQDHQYTTHFVSDTTFYYSDTAVDILVTAIILLLGLGMLLGPAWWLQRVETLTQRLEIISLFVPLFTLLLVMVTPVRPFETVAATSAYVLFQGLRYPLTTCQICRRINGVHAARSK
ncbi:hypothetical protein K402DRAFT_173849 [Aulographum hederae CBS 113979]|uniref:DUF6594 domain-containing protein n=1 Tax=Aulographum hederae CBS 113979 TaxID=1176131 RepID=A0A6G1HDF0_9PEZI|nr:hypothetical protein K402DRAFT_173849 [Aulographum hederae CBS 113979]